MTAIHAIAIDGPREKPNGYLLVELTSQADDSNFFLAKVKEIRSATSRTSPVGERIKVHLSAIENLVWVK